MRKLVALVDGSLYSQSVCELSGWIAARTGASVEALHVIGRRQAEGGAANLSGSIALGARTTLLNELSELDERLAKLSQARGRAILDDAAASLSASGAQTVTTRLRAGDLLETLEETEADADAIVLGKRGEAADFARLHLGSNLERIVRAASKPVFVAARAFRPIKRVLIAFDGGASSLKAVDHVARSSVLAGLDIRLLTVGADTPESRSRLEGAVATLSAGGHAAARQGDCGGSGAGRHRSSGDGRLRPFAHPLADHRVDHHGDGALLQDPGASAALMLAPPAASEGGRSARLRYKSLQRFARRPGRRPAQDDLAG
jgi:nucleotide-binding universal stress UspA family protein